MAHKRAPTQLSRADREEIDLSLGLAYALLPQDSRMVLQLLIAGIALGSIYTLLSLASVLIHKATEVINFAQGEMAMVGTFIAYSLMKNLGLPIPLVLFLALSLGLVIGGVTELLAIRPLAGSPSVNLLIISIGLWMVFHYRRGKRCIL